jgi:hypothetical protein
MAMSIGDLRSLLDKENLKYYVSPDSPEVMAGFGGAFGSYRVTIRLELDGTFLQFRSMAYLSCPDGHQSLDAVLRVLGDLNYKLRMAKFGWDESDGEIVAYADVWLEDQKLSHGQLRRMLGGYVWAIDVAHQRIQATIATGEDPGLVDPQEVAKKTLEHSGVPEAMKKLLEKLAGKTSDDEESEPVRVPTL